MDRYDITQKICQAVVSKMFASESMQERKKKFICMHVAAAPVDNISHCWHSKLERPMHEVLKTVGGLIASVLNEQDVLITYYGTWLTHHGYRKLAIYAFQMALIWRKQDDRHNGKYKAESQHLQKSTQPQRMETGQNGAALLT